MKLPGQGFQKLESEQDRQTDCMTDRHKDRRDRTHYHAAFADSNLITSAENNIIIYTQIN